MSFTMRYEATKKALAKKSAAKANRPKGFFAAFEPKKPYGWDKTKKDPHATN